MDDMELWPEIEKAAAGKRRELVLQGPAVDGRISSHGGLTSAIYSLPLLNYLEVSQCPSLTEIHEDIQHLTNLQSLILCRNKLACVPGVVGNLKSLKVLDLSVNNLRVLPEGITQLRELNTLNVSCNSLEVLPEGLSQCTKLSTINISKNRITAFPADFCSDRLDLLSTLVASENSIEQLPAEVHKLAALKVGRAVTRARLRQPDFTCCLYCRYTPHTHTHQQLLHTYIILKWRFFFFKKSGTRWVRCTPNVRGVVTVLCVYLKL